VDASGEGDVAASGGISLSISSATDPGVDPVRLGCIFDAFFTTKKEGMGAVLQARVQDLCQTGSPRIPKMAPAFRAFIDKSSYVIPFDDFYVGVGPIRQSSNN
jgi:hypothetical protein